MNADLNSSGNALASIGQARTRNRTSDRVYAELTAAIREMRLPPGASISETDLSAQLRVSRTPLREAISKLVDNGLVSVVPQVGTRVELIRLRDVELARFMRESMEVEVFATACGKAERDTTALRLLLVEQQRCCDQHDLEGFFAADEALHAEIFAIGGYPGAWRAMQPMKVHLDRLRRLSLPDPATVRGLIAEHTAIVEALESGDVGGGQTVIRGHAHRVLDNAPRLRAAHPDYFTE